MAERALEADLESYEIASDLLRASIKTAGAELCMLRTGGGTDLLWSGDPAVWGRQAPTLFPVVGAMAGDRLLHKGVSYPMPKHGFARDLDFRLVRLSAHACAFRLKDDDGTRASYPFPFQLDLAFSILGAELKVQYHLHNPGDRDLPASFGAHPAFRWPLDESVAPDGYSLRFDRTETANRLEVGSDGLLTGRKVPFFRDVDQLKLRPDLFRAGAVVLEGLKSESVTLGADTGPGVRLQAPGAKWWGFWTKPGAPFLCMEPWHGVADTFGADWDLRGKPGIMALAPGDSWSWTLQIDPF